MTDHLGEVRAMLSLFDRSDWSDLHIRTDAVELFMAKPDGAANPMAREGAEATSEFEITAPHLATIVSLAATGTQVVEGDPVAVIEVLGEPENVLATASGTIFAQAASPGTLIEFGQPLVTLTI